MMLGTISCGGVIQVVISRSSMVHVGFTQTTKKNDSVCVCACVRVCVCGNNVTH